jgi:SAM-dependent methyltransferase
MGLERFAAAILLKMRDDGVSFGRALTLGHQHVHLDAEQYARVRARAGAPPDPAIPQYADDVLRLLGASSVESMDYSGYEGATIVHDLNKPVPPTMHGQFDLVFDGGTLEHVFDFPTAIRSCMELVRVGGRFVTATIPNNFCGHGFYQFSPELFFRVLSPDNGFSVVEMYVCEVGGRTRQVMDPAVVKSRVELCNSRPAFLLVHARRDAAVPMFTKTPQQSDYVASWMDGKQGGATRTPAAWKRLPVMKQLRRLKIRMDERSRLRERSLSNATIYKPADLRL